MEFDRDQLSKELLKSFDKQSDIDLDGESGIPVKILLPLIVLAAICFGIYAWRSDKIAISRNDGSEIHLVRANKDEVRSRPNDPGGMHIANRDKRIYEAISNKESKSLPKVVQLLPKHEEPISREIIKSGNVGLPDLFDDVAVLVSKESPLKVAAKALKESEIIAKHELMSKDVTVLNGAEDAIKGAVTVDDIKNVPLPTVRAKRVVEPSIITPGYKMQLGSYRTEGDVQANWKKIKSKYESLFGDLQLYTEKADLGDRGVFYRLQLGSLGDESKARAVCQKLIEQKQGCFVVKK